MIKAMRKHAKYFYFLFFIVILTFIFWGVGRVDNSGEKEILAEVGKYKIPAREFWRSYERTSRFYREIYKDRYEEIVKTMNLKEQILNSMINEHILLIKAQEMGINISDQELQDAITHEPMFMKDGVFNQEMYVNRLRLNRLNPESYEAMKRQELTIKKMRRLIELTVDISMIESQLGQVSGDEQIKNLIREQMLNDMKEKAVKSYIEGLKEQIKVVVKKDLIT